MLTLLLLRHAKSSWAQAGVADFDRPLSPRGIAAAPKMGAFIAGHGLVPDAILCSTALRTRETLRLVLSRLGADAASKVHYENGLYLASADEILERIRATGGDVQRLMVVGHNPGMHELAGALAGSGDAAALAALGEKYPTAGLAVLSFPQRTWREIRTGGGRLVYFAAPKMLA